MKITKISTTQKLPTIRYVFNLVTFITPLCPFIVHLFLSLVCICTYLSSQLYVRGCVELLKHVHTPWSESVEELVQQCLKVDHPVVSMLEKQYSLLKLKKLLHGYGVRDFNFSDASQGWVSCCLWIYFRSHYWKLNFPVCHLFQLYIRRILISGGGPTVLEDALKVWKCIAWLVVIQTYWLSCVLGHIFIVHIPIGRWDVQVWCLRHLQTPSHESGTKKQCMWHCLKLCHIKPHPSASTYYVQ